MMPGNQPGGGMSGMSGMPGNQPGMGNQPGSGGMRGNQSGGRGMPQQQTRYDDDEWHGHGHGHHKHKHIKITGIGTDTATSKVDSQPHYRSGSLRILPHGPLERGRCALFYKASRSQADGALTGLGLVGQAPLNLTMPSRATHNTAIIPRTPRRGPAYALELKPRDTVLIENGRELSQRLKLRRRRTKM